MECAAEVILACPFCGSQKTVLKAQAGAYAVACETCGGIGPAETMQGEAVQRWNSRAALAASFRRMANYRETVQ